MHGGLVRYQQRPSQEGGFLLNPAVAVAIAVRQQGWGKGVSKKAVRKLMRDVAALAREAVPVVVHDRSPPSAGHRQRRESGTTRTKEVETRLAAIR